MYQVHFSMFSKENSKYAPIPCNNPTEKIAKLTNDVAVNKQNDRKDIHVKSTLLSTYRLPHITRNPFQFNKSFLDFKSICTLMEK